MAKIKDQGDTLREPLALKITPAMKTALEQKAEETGTSIPKVVRTAIEWFLRPEGWGPGDSQGDDLLEVTIRVKDLRHA